MTPPPPRDPWFILAGIANAVKSKKAKHTIPPGADVSVAYADPPRAAVLTVRRRISSPASLCSHPYVAAADPSGLLLLCATKPEEGANSWITITYHLCDARTGEATCLRAHSRGVGFHGHNLGLMVRNGGSCVVVAELQPAGYGTGRALLLTYAVGVGQYWWAEKALTYSPPLQHREWRGEGVVSHGGMLRWVDLSYGLLACDTSADEPELLHVPLPSVADQLLPVLFANAGAHRCVRVSGGMLRFVQIHGSLDAPVVSTWALVEPSSSGEWNPERRVELADVWADESYVDIMLPGTIPALALLDTVDPDKVFFFLGSCIFAVDLRLRKVVEFSNFAMPDSPNKLLVRSSRFVHAWQYDPSSRLSEPLLRCLRQEKESSLAAVIPISRKTAKIQRRFRYDSIREQQYLNTDEATPTRKVGHRRGHYMMAPHGVSYVQFFLEKIKEI